METLESIANRIVDDLEAHKGDEDILINGPYEATIKKVRDMYRLAIMIRGTDLTNLKEYIYNSWIFTQEGLLIDVVLYSIGVSMAVLDVVKAGHPVLKQVAEPVEHVNKKLRALIDDMAETMYKTEGVGLAAPQVAVSKRIIVVDDQVGSGLIVLINPELHMLKALK